MMKSNKSITLIISNINKSNNFEWTIIELLKHYNNLSILLLNPIKNTSFEAFLRNYKVNYKVITYKGKLSIPRAVFQTLLYLKKMKTELVHCHLFEASLIGLWSAKILGIKKRIHTRHNATIHHQYHPQAVKYDKFINRLSTHIISISKNTSEILTKLENVPENKISLVYHGFDFDQIACNSPEIKIQLQSKYNIAGKPVIGVVSRYIDWKGVPFIIDAFSEFQRENPGAQLVLVNASGPLKPMIQKKISQLPPSCVIEIPFEEQIFCLMDCFDIFVHAPVSENSEAFGQVYIESMALKIPSMFTASGIAAEIAIHNENCKVAEFKDSSSILKCLRELFHDKELQEKLANNAYSLVLKNFSVQKSVKKQVEIYES
ncbi:MAG TPA: glycosyltransferase family 4 protein [Flavobacteriales bacterium]|nr:glycosyltransferase family 4 protein [Flavobacteriales bacterium]